MSPTKIFRIHSGCNRGSTKACIQKCLIFVCSEMPWTASGPRNPVQSSDCQGRSGSQEGMPKMLRILLSTKERHQWQWIMTDINISLLLCSNHVKSLKNLKGKHTSCGYEYSFLLRFFFCYFIKFEVYFTNKFSFCKIQNVYYR